MSTDNVNKKGYKKCKQKQKETKKLYKNKINNNFCLYFLKSEVFFC